MSRIAVSPLASVIFPVFNAQDFLSEAIESILDQTFQDFELLVIDDGSRDSSLQIIKKYPDSRIKVLLNKVQKGLIFSLNRGIAEARGKYLIRMDADDWSSPDRFQKQIDLMEAHPEIGLAGCAFELIDAKGSLLDKIQYPLKDADIQCHLLYCNAIIHPGSIIRSQVLMEHKIRYQPAQKLVEDYAFFLEIARVSQLANLPDFLLKKRAHPQRSSIIHQEIQQKNLRKIMAQQLSRLQIQPLPQEWDTYFKMIYGNSQLSIDFIKRLHDWLLKLAQKNELHQVFPAKAFEELLIQHWLKHSLGYSRLGIELGKLFVFSPLSQKAGFSWYFKIKFLVKCLLRI